MIRRYGGEGSAESENGCAVLHSPGARNRQLKNWPPETANRSSAFEQNRDRVSGLVGDLHNPPQSPAQSTPAPVITRSS